MLNLFVTNLSVCSVSIRSTCYISSTVHLTINVKTFLKKIPFKNRNMKSCKIWTFFTWSLDTYKIYVTCVTCKIVFHVEPAAFIAELHQSAIARYRSRISEASRREAVWQNPRISVRTRHIYYPGERHFVCAFWNAHSAALTTQTGRCTYVSSNSITEGGSREDSVVTWDEKCKTARRNDVAGLYVRGRQS